MAKIFVDPQANEAYIADGYLNKRVAVLDADTGKMKRYWGAYGNKPDDRTSAPTIRTRRRPSSSATRCTAPTCRTTGSSTSATASTIASRCSQGREVRQGRVHREEHAGAGSVWDIAFSRDPQQRYIFVADGMNQRVHIVERETLELLTSFGDGGRQPGQFYGVHSIAIDSKGNLYTTETYEGKRLQKFVYQGHRHRCRGSPGRRVAPAVAGWWLVVGGR